MSASVLSEHRPASSTKIPRSQITFWFCLSLTFAVLYAIPALRQAFSSEYVVQDDARQHVFWMMRFTDPALFPNDLLADYFQSVAPWGYSTVYRIFAWVGVQPMLLHKLLPPVLALITTAYGFGVCLQILPVPIAGFLSTLLLNQSLWMKDDIVSGTPSAFVYPIFLAFLYYLLKRALIPCLIAIALQGLFYPQCMFIFCGVLLLRLLRWKQGRLRLSQDRHDYWFLGAGLAIAVLVMIPYALRSSEFGPTATAAIARKTPAFIGNKWSEFYQTNPAYIFRKFWLCGTRSGILPPEWCGVDYGPLNSLSSVKTPATRVDFALPQIVFWLLLPVMLAFPSRFPLSRQVNQNVFVLLQTFLTSVGLFFVAHAVVFKLHLPNRYTEHSFRIVGSLAAGIALTLLIDAVFQMNKRRSQPDSFALANSPANKNPANKNPANKNSRAGFLDRIDRKRSAGLSFSVLLGAALLLYPQFLRLKEIPFPITNYIVGHSPALYQFFAQQPKNIVIASIAPEVNNLPSFTQRSILVGGEGYTLPYHLGYYRQMVQRTQDLVQAQYSPNRDEVKRVIQKHGISFWLLDRNAFKPNYPNNNPILVEFDDLGASVKASLQSGSAPVLSHAPKGCTVFHDSKYKVIDAKCIAQ